MHYYSKLMMYIIALLIIVNITICPLSAIQNNVEEGTYSTYGFQASLSVDSIKNLYCVGEVGWECLGKEDTLVKMRQWISFSVPYEYYDVIKGDLRSNNLFFMGEEYVHKAKEGDLSFVPWFPEENITISNIVEPYMVTNPSTGEEMWINEYSVTISVSGEYYFEDTVYVDLVTREVYDTDHNTFGRWLWWINPEQYPYGEKTTELFRYSWCNQNLNCTVKYVSKDTYAYWEIYDTRFEGKYDECFTMSPWAVSCGTDEEGNEIVLLASIAYSASSGMPIWARGGVGLQDDVTYHMTNGLDLYPYVEFNIDEKKEGRVTFELIETNLVPTKIDEFNDNENFNAYIIFEGIIILLGITISLMFIIKYKRR